MQIRWFEIQRSKGTANLERWEPSEFPHEQLVAIPTLWFHARSGGQGIALWIRDFETLFTTVTRKKPDVALRPWKTSDGTFLDPSPSHVQQLVSFQWRTFQGFHLPSPQRLFSKNEMPITTTRTRFPSKFVEFAELEPAPLEIIKIIEFSQLVAMVSHKQLQANHWYTQNNCMDPENDDFLKAVLRL